jgi:hypothetical protein
VPRGSKNGSGAIMRMFIGKNPNNEQIINYVVKTPFRKFSPKPLLFWNKLRNGVIVGLIYDLFLRCNDGNEESVQQHSTVIVA